MATGTSRLAPSSGLALYLAAVLTVYLTRDPAISIVVAAVLCCVAIAIMGATGSTIPSRRWIAPAFFVAWVFVMRLALDLVGGAPADAAALVRAASQGARVAVLIIGGLVLIAATPARRIVDELETTRLPRSARLLVMMLVQYPRVLRDRYDQIVEAQIARGADRPRTVVQRLRYAGRVLLPVMQSELNAVGDRASLIHLRGLDLDVARDVEQTGRGMLDFLVLTAAALAVISSVALRVLTR
jgi:energy-coupling factor transporter transmembrane protein EcfT